MDGSSALRKPPLGHPFRTLVTSTGLSNLADGVFKVALPLLAIRFTRSPASALSLLGPAAEEAASGGEGGRRR